MDRVPPRGGYASHTSGFSPFPIGHSTGPVLALHGTVSEAPFPHPLIPEETGGRIPRKTAAQPGHCTVRQQTSMTFVRHREQVQVWGMAAPTRGQLFSWSSISIITT